MHQMTIFEYMHGHEDFDPLMQVALRASPTNVGHRLLVDTALRSDHPLDNWLVDYIRGLYSPHGFAGHSGIADQPYEVEGWRMETKHITVEWRDENMQVKKLIYTWRDFAERLQRLCQEGRYDTKVKEWGQ